MQLQPGIESSQKRFDALCFFQIVKERNSPGSKARRQGALPRPRAWVPQWDGGGERDRTDDLLLAKQALSQLSYGPDRDQASGISNQKAAVRTSA